MAAPGTCDMTMSIHISGTRDGLVWPEVGGVQNVPDVEGAELAAAGIAVEVEG